MVHIMQSRGGKSVSDVMGDVTYRDELFVDGGLRLIVKHTNELCDGETELIFDGQETRNLMLRLGPPGSAELLRKQNHALHESKRQSKKAKALEQRAEKAEREAADHASKVAELENELAEVEKQRDVAQRECAVLAGENAGLRQRAMELDEEVIRDEVQGHTIAISPSELECVAAEAVRACIEIAKSTINRDEDDDYAEQLVDTEYDLSEANRHVEKLKLELQERENQLAALTQQYDEMTKTCAGWGRDAEQFKTTVQRQQNEIEQLRRERQRIADDKTMLTNQKTKLTNQVDGLKKRAEEAAHREQIAKTSLDERRVLNASQRNLIDELKKSVTAHLRDRNDWADRCGKAEKERDALKEQVAQLSDAVVKDKQLGEAKCFIAFARAVLRRRINPDPSVTKIEWLRAALPMCETIPNEELPPVCIDGNKLCVELNQRLSFCVEMDQPCEFPADAPKVPHRVYENGVAVPTDVVKDVCGGRGPSDQPADTLSEAAEGQIPPEPADPAAETA